MIFHDLPLASPVSSPQKSWKASPRERSSQLSLSRTPCHPSWSLSHQGTGPWTASTKQNVFHCCKMFRTDRFEALNLSMLNRKSTKQVVKLHSLILHYLVTSYRNYHNIFNQVAHWRGKIKALPWLRRPLVRQHCTRFRSRSEPFDGNRTVWAIIAMCKQTSCNVSVNVRIYAMHCGSIC